MIGSKAAVRYASTSAAGLPPPRHVLQYPLYQPHRLDPLPPMPPYYSSEMDSPPLVPLPRLVSEGSRSHHSFYPQRQLDPTSSSRYRSSEMDSPPLVLLQRPISETSRSHHSFYPQRQLDPPSSSRAYYSHMNPQLPRFPPRSPYQIYTNPQPSRLPSRPSYQIYADPQPSPLPPRPTYQIYRDPQPPRPASRLPYETYNHPESFRFPPDSPLQLNSAPVPTFHCGICLELYSQVDTVHSDPCAHSFCKNCMRDYITSKLQDREIPSVCPTCMADSSEGEPGTVNHLAQEVGLSGEEFELWSQLEMESTGVNVQCPRCESVIFVDRPEYEGRMILACPLVDCNHLWCKFCQFAVPSINAQHSCDGSEELDELVRRKKWQRCPGCHSIVQKTSGCNQVQCRCKTNFCYGCGQLISQHDNRNCIG